MKTKRFPQSKKFRVIVNEVSFYSTAKEIRYGVGDSIFVNAAVQKALDALEFTRSGAGAADQAAVGIAGMWEGRNVQINIA